ncbi:MAG: flagellar biosynthetic protein FliR [Acidobacteria bacterium]|nr:flagellar biosynthetic protein FliR [Acidobacteriota bacterium]
MIPLTAIYGFLLALARVSGVFVFVPIPWVRTGPAMARVVLSVCFTLSLFPVWSNLIPAEPALGQFLTWLAVDATLGLLVGLAVAVVTESFLLGAQVVSLQAGYGFAVFFDPNTDAESTVIIRLVQILTGLLFFLAGLDRMVLKIFARSLEVYPPGSFHLSRSLAETVVALISNVFSMGLRLVLPVVALLVVVDLALALLGRLNAQLQLITLAFPIKMLAALAMLATVVFLYPKLFQQAAEVSFGVLFRLLKW